MAAAAAAAAGGSVGLTHSHSNSDKIIRDLSVKLDDLLIAYMNAYDEYNALYSKFSNNVKEGHFFLSKARYTMGYKSVSELQFDPSMKALIKCDIESSSDTPAPESSGRSKKPIVDADHVGNSLSVRVRRLSVDALDGPGPSTIANVHVLAGSGRNEERSHFASSQGQHSAHTQGNTSLRSRRGDEVTGGQSGQQGASGADDIAMADLKGGPKAIGAARVLKDPIKWFGVLVPPTLRTCQSHFREAIDVVPKLAEMRHSMERLRAEYDALLHHKEQLVKAAEAAATQTHPGDAAPAQS